MQLKKSTGWVNPIMKHCNKYIPLGLGQCLHVFHHMAWVNQMGEKFGGRKCPHQVETDDRNIKRQHGSFLYIQNLRWKGWHICPLSKTETHLHNILFWSIQVLKTLLLFWLGHFLEGRWKCELTCSFFSPARKKKRHSFFPTISVS